MLEELLCEPRYSLRYTVTGDIPLDIFCKNKFDIKKFLLNFCYNSASTIYNTKCNLYLLYNLFDDGHLNHIQRPVTERLEDITADTYVLTIASTGSVNYYFKSLVEIKKFLKKFNNGGGTWSYTIHHNTAYFNKNDNYRISIKSETITEFDI